MIFCKLPNNALDEVSLPVNAFGQAGQSLTCSAAGLPPGLSINAATGVISGTVSSAASLTTPYSVTVTATDGSYHTSQTFLWTVSVINIVSPGDQSNLDGDTVSLAADAQYFGSGSLTYSATGLPSGLSINSSTGATTGTLASTADVDSPYTVVLTASHGTA